MKKFGAYSVNNQSCQSHLIKKLVIRSQIPKIQAVGVIPEKEPYWKKSWKRLREKMQCINRTCHWPRRARLASIILRLLARDNNPTIIILE